ncbi:MAG TPA: phosphatase PAP2 family protein, partial [Nevskiaceae bacterium]|nr:phosphatase PAP2 family protein [Nevskiaceae bacterium]
MTAPQAARQPTVQFYVAALALLLLLLEWASLSGVCPSPLQSLVHTLPLVPASFTMDGGRFGLLAVLYLFAERRLIDRLAVLLGGVAIAATVYAANPQAGWGLVQFAGNLFNGAGLAALIRTWAMRLDPVEDQRQYAVQLLWAYAVTLSLSLVIGPLLSAGAELHPATYDFQLFRIDSALGLDLSARLGGLARLHPWLGNLLVIVYMLEPCALMALYALQIRRPLSGEIRALDLMVGSGLAAWLAYNLYPVCGPAYAFGTEYFPLKLPAPAAVPHGLSVIAHDPRNGMPSMHFGWALAMWVIALRRGWPVRVAFSLVLALTAIATIALGEHYVLDLLFCIPFLLALLAVLSFHLPMSGVRLQAIAFGGSAYLVCICLLVRWPDLLAQSPLGVWSMVLCSVLPSVPLYWRLLRERPGDLPAAVSIDIQAEDRLLSRLPWVIGSCTSVAAMGQLLQLQQAFGDGSVMVPAALAGCIAGLAIGARNARRWRTLALKPMAVIAGCCLAAAIYAVFFRYIGAGALRGYLAWARDTDADAPHAALVRAVLGAMVQLVPGICSGAAITMLAGLSGNAPAAVGKRVLRAVLGLAIGIAVAGYLLLPVIGVRRTLLVAALVYMVLALLALNRSKRRVMAAAAVDKPALNIHVWVGAALAGSMSAALLLILLKLAGLVAGANIYTSTGAWAVAATGLASGAALGMVAARGVDRRQALIGVAAVLVLLLLVVIAVAGAAPGYFSSFGLTQVAPGFGEREIIRSLVAGLLVVPAALVIGGGWAVARAEDMSAALGGGAAGLLIAVAALQMIGPLPLLQVACAIGFATFAVLVWRWHRVARWRFAAGAVVAGVLLLPRAATDAGLQAGSYRDFRPQQQADAMPAADIYLRYTPARDAGLLLARGAGEAKFLSAAGFRTVDSVEAGTNRASVRGRLMLMSRQYDLIAAGDATSGDRAELSSREFYRLVAAHLRPRGIFAQPVALDRLSPVELRYIVGSLRAEFAQVRVVVA